MTSSAFLKTNVYSLLSAALISFSCSGTPSSSAKSPAASAPTTSAQMVYRDPVTGQIGAPPPGTRPTGAAPAGMNTSSTGLQQTASPGGGVMVDLQGRFQSFSRVRADGNGKVTAECDNAEHGEKR
jgi:hypothetical protein